MQTVNVVKSFTLTLDDGTAREFSPGKQMLEDELAAHWFVKPHLGDVSDAEDGLEAQGLATLEVMEADLKAEQAQFELSKTAAEAVLLTKAKAVADAEAELMEAQTALAADRTAFEQDRTAFEAAKQLAATSATQSTKKK